MKKIKMNVDGGKTFEQGCEAYLIDCKARNLRNGTIKHYKDAFKQIFKFWRFENSYVLFHGGILAALFQNQTG